MHPGQLKPFLFKEHVVIDLANKASTALFVKGDTEISRHVRYVSAENSAEFNVELLNIHLVARLEFLKLMINGETILSGQYAFFRKAGESEQRLSTALRLVPPNHIVLPDGQVVDVGPRGLESSIEFSVRDSLSVALLSELVDQMECWSYA